MAQADSGSVSVGERRKFQNVSYQGVCMAVKTDTLVIFGVTGDLARRMLLPSLYFLERDGLLDTNIRIVGAARSALDDARFRAVVHETIAERKEGVDETVWQRLARRLAYCKVNAENAADYAALGQRVGR